MARQVGNRGSHLASRPLRPCTVSWRSWQCRPRRCLQVQQHSAEAHHDQPPNVVDRRLSGNNTPAGSFSPSVWGDSFLHYFDPEGSHEQMQDEWSNVGTKINKCLYCGTEGVSNSVTCSLPQRLHLIDALERLCLDHLFEEEINRALTQFITANVSDCELRTVALWFYLLRKHGYKVSPDVFMRFKDEEEGFLTHDPIDLLNFYNAASLRTHGETILDEAASFTRRSLETTLRYLKGSLAHEIKCALEIPLPRRVRIYGSKYYISTCEKEDTVHGMVLELAKLNSNIMQLHYQQELKIITRWWKDLQIESRLPFARDRIVECYLWMLGVYFEPCYSRGRIILTMVISIATIFDDIFYSYGTAEECEIFTKCIESWDPKAARDLPECMKFALEKIMNSYQIIEHELVQEEKYRMPYLRNFTVDLVRGYNAEVKMREAAYVPKSIEEHLQVSLRTGACHLLSCASFVGMGDIATKDSFEWVSSMPKMVQALCIILRLLDDLQTYEREQMTPHVASTIDSYMKQHNVSIEIARNKIQELKEESWKDFNGEWLNASATQSKQIVERIFNLTRTMEFFYNKDDNFTNCHNIKDTIRSLFVEPFTI